ncbi:MAG: hypothetical protein ACXAEU_17055, partial [Candidatus Hodarchaeales archaeon]
MWELLKEAEQGIPWASAAVLMAKLREVERAPQPVVLTKQAAAGLFKLGRMRKTAQTPEQLAAEYQQAALTDPEVMAALAQREAESERNYLVQQIQELQAANEVSQQQMAMADQTAQQAQAQTEQTSAML